MQVDLKSAVRLFGQTAVIEQSILHDARDRIALAAVDADTNEGSIAVIASWLRSYSVLQRVRAEKSLCVARAFLGHVQEKRNVGAQNLVRIHQELMELCCVAMNNTIQYSSMSSKLLWLLFPNDVPMFDKFVRRGLAIANGMKPDAGCLYEYPQFVKVWRAAQLECDPELKKIEMYGYPHEVRILDKVLGYLGQPEYRTFLERASTPSTSSSP
jgi:hypothetical protein